VQCIINITRMDRLFILNNRVVHMFNQMNNQITTPKETMLLNHNNSKVNR
jgi:hypothetical protein